MKLLKEMMEYGFTVKVKREFKNKRGDVFPEGSTVNCEFTDSRIRVSVGEISVNIPYSVASKYLTKFKPAPSMKALERMVYDGIATTPLGNRTEVDGEGVYGEPSWPRVLGIV